MKLATTFTIAALLSVFSANTFAEDIILRLRPDASAPVITRIVATGKALIDAAPAGQNGDWRQLELKVPFDAYVPEAALTKSLAILQDTPVHFLPDANSEVITTAKDGDLYEVVRVKDKWATIRYNKKLTTYFRAEATAEATVPETIPPTPLPALPELLPEEPALDMGISAPTHTPQPNAKGFDPNLSVGITSPEDLPPENVVWKSASESTASNYEPEPEPQAEPIRAEPPQLAGGIMVSPAQTQAREAETLAIPEPDAPLRLLVGTLVREIDSSSRAYPIRLYSAEGRLIAYVDFSGMFVEELSPYLDQRVYLRGQIAPAKPNSRDLVMFVQDIQLSH